MNYKLYRLHRVLFIAYVSFASVMMGISLLRLIQGFDPLIGLAIASIFMVLVPSTAHYFGSKGAREGKDWGRTLSRVIGAVMLIGVPLGTIIGWYLFKYTSSKQWESEVRPPLSS